MLVAGSRLGSELSQSKKMEFPGLAKEVAFHQAVEMALLCRHVPCPWMVCVGGCPFQICLVEFGCAPIGPSSWKVGDLEPVAHNSNLLHSIANRIASVPSGSSGHVQSVHLCSAPMASRRIHSGLQWLCSASYRMHNARVFWKSPPSLH